MNIRNKRGSVPGFVLVFAVGLTIILTRAIALDDINYPNFKAKPKTVDTIENPAPPIPKDL